MVETYSRCGSCHAKFQHALETRTFKEYFERCACLWTLTGLDKLVFVSQNARFENILSTLPSLFSMLFLEVFRVGRSTPNIRWILGEALRPIRLRQAWRLNA